MIFTVTAAQNILFERNLFQHMGSTAIDLFYGTKNCEITGNIITDISGNGIAVEKFVEDRFTEIGIPYNPKDKREICTKDVVNNLYEGQKKAKAIKEKAGLEPKFKYLKTKMLIMMEKEMIKTKELVFLADLKNEEEAIKKYMYYHSAEGVWPEVIHAAKVSGIEKVRIYRFGNHLVMTITVPVNSNIDEVNRKYAESSIRIKEWEELMSTFLQPPTGAKENATFVPMELIHDYENGVVK